MTKYRWIIAIVALLVASLACSALGGRSTGAGGSGGADGSGGNYKTEFPLPANVSNFVDLGNGAINFQTTLSLQDTIAFYRDAFTKAGYQERPITTVVSDTTFSMVFDGHPSGKAIVIQGVDLGGKTNVNIRFEDV